MTLKECDHYKNVSKMIILGCIAFMSFLCTSFYALLSQIQVNKITIFHFQGVNLYDSVYNVKCSYQRRTILKALFGKKKGTKVYITKKANPLPNQSTSSNPTYSTQKVRMHQGRIMSPEEYSLKSLSKKKLSNLCKRKEKTKKKDDNIIKSNLSTIQERDNIDFSDEILRKRGKKRKFGKVPSSESFNYTARNSHGLIRSSSKLNPNSHHIKKISKMHDDLTGPSVSSLGKGMRNLDIHEHSSVHHSLSGSGSFHHDSEGEGRSHSHSKTYTNGGSSTRARRAMDRTDSTLSTDRSPLFSGPILHIGSPVHSEHSSQHSDHSDYIPKSGSTTPRSDSSTRPDWWLGGNGSSSDSDTD